MLLQNRLKPNPDSPGIEIIKSYGKIPAVECHASQINQVFMNLLANAIDALEAQAQDLSFQHLKLHQQKITIATALSDRNTVEITIADNGSGIPDDIRDKLFDPFFTTKPVGKGTGIGLSISRKIICENHQGQLHCASRVREGTTFTIELPLQPVSVAS